MNEYVVVQSVALSYQTVDAEGNDHFLQVPATTDLVNAVNAMSKHGWQPVGGPFWEVGTLCLLMTREAVPAPSEQPAPAALAKNKSVPLLPGLS